MRASHFHLQRSAETHNTLQDSVVDEEARADRLVHSIAPPKESNDE